MEPSGRLGKGRPHAPFLLSQKGEKKKGRPIAAKEGGGEINCDNWDRREFIQSGLRGRMSLERTVRKREKHLLFGIGKYGERDLVIEGRATNFNRKGGTLPTPNLPRGEGERTGL